MLRQSLLIGALALVGCASTGITQSYADYAGPSIREFKYTSLHRWERASDRSIVVWTRMNEAYLLTMTSDCVGWSANDPIRIDDFYGIPGRLHAGSGKVVIGNQHCRVSAIQPVDLLRMRRERQS